MKPLYCVSGPEGVKSWSLAPCRPPGAKIKITRWIGQHCLFYRDETIIVLLRVCRNLMTRPVPTGSQPTRDRGSFRTLLGPSLKSRCPIISHLCSSSTSPFPSIKGAWKNPEWKWAFMTIVLPSASLPCRFCWTKLFLYWTLCLLIYWLNPVGAETAVHCYSCPLWVTKF